MADDKISALTAIASPLVSTDVVPIVRSGAATTTKATVQQLQDYVTESVANTLRNQSTADQSPTAATLTYLTGSQIVIPTGKLRVGTRFYWRIALSKTGVGTAASVFHVRVGTAGTTADTAVLTFTTGGGSANADQGYIDIDVTCRGPLSSSGKFQGLFVMGHELATTGLLTKALNVLQALSANFDVTTAGLKVGLSVTSGSTIAFTFTQVNADVVNL